MNKENLKEDRENLKENIDNFLSDTKPITEKRKAGFKSLMSFVLDGKQWSDSEIKDRDGDPVLTFNFSEDYIERYLARLFPRSPRTGVMEVGVKISDDENAKFEKEILDVYKKNNLPNILLGQGTNFLVGGAACFYYPQDPITKKAEIISLDPTTVYLGWKGEKLVQFAFKDELGNGKERIIYYDLANIVVIEGDEMKEIYVNKYGFIPFTWIPNFPKPHKHEGRSKILSLFELDCEYNQRASDYSKRTEENTDPHLAIFSDEVEAKKVKRGRKRKTKLGKDDDMKYLELSEGKEILDYLNMIERIMRRKTGIIDSAEILKSAVSGFSLALQYSDMMDLIGFMRIFWDKAFREMNSAILTYKFGAGSYESDPVYHPFIMYDSKERVDEYAVMLDKDIISRRVATDELRGVENADEKVKEIIDEKMKFSKNNQSNKKIDEK